MKTALRVSDNSVTAINRKMADLEEALRNVPRFKRVTTLTPGGVAIYTAGIAGDPVFVTHNWGRVPTGFIANAEGDTRIYATAEDKAKWSETVFVFRGSGTSVKVELTLIAHEDA